MAQLNRDIQKFIDRLMKDSGPYLNLTPCFDDYIKHFQRLTTEEEERQQKNNNNNISTTYSMTSITGGFGTSTGAVTTSKAAADTEPKITFSFGAKAATTPFTTTAPKASTDCNSNVGPSAGFNFGVPANTVSNSLNSNSSSSGAKDANSPVKFTFGAPPSTSQAASSSASSPVKSVFRYSSAVFGAPTSSTASTEPPVTFKFGSTLTAGSGDKTAEKATTSKPVFAFNAKTGFEFGSTISASNSAIPATTAVQDDNDDEEEAPPKVEVTHEEEGSLYMKKVAIRSGVYKKTPVHLYDYSMHIITPTNSDYIRTSEYTTSIIRVLGLG